MVKCEKVFQITYDNNKLYYKSKNDAIKIRNKCILAGYKNINIKEVLRKIK